VTLSITLSLIPGLVLGGWKAISVALGRSVISRRRDVAWIAVFGVWAIGWSLVSLVDIVSSW
jgi:hypothetical protein